MGVSTYPPFVSRLLSQAGFQRAAVEKGIPTGNGFCVTQGDGGGTIVRYACVLSGQRTARQSALTHYQEYLSMAGYRVEPVADPDDPGMFTELHIWRKR